MESLASEDVLVGVGVLDREETGSDRKDEDVHGGDDATYADTRFRLPEEAPLLVRSDAPALLCSDRQACGLATPKAVRELGEHRKGIEIT